MPQAKRDTEAQRRREAEALEEAKSAKDQARQMAEAAQAEKGCFDNLVNKIKNINEENRNRRVQLQAMLGMSRKLSQVLLSQPPPRRLLRLPLRISVVMGLRPEPRGPACARADSKEEAIPVDDNRNAARQQLRDLIDVKDEATFSLCSRYSPRTPIAVPEALPPVRPLMRQEEPLPRSEVFERSSVSRKSSTAPH